ncbi:MAG: GyrI-like domain-containing protein [Spirochaetales bacterium]|uniref:GyrI-like domain-containing protein n=1 Tax=Candidatus Thalassospirochaeta sargassi TaxID=3119039 RepID=A0AAJ1IF99_9SPIO|nr:GyrI-like domain-containing protein [Spirochaetales bacterium]
MKHEWKKKEKLVYMPKNTPEFIEVPEFSFFTVSGRGNPNEDFFGEYIGILYSLSYAVRMSHKQGLAPSDYYEYTVYPLEGVWDLTEEGRLKSGGGIDKNELIFTLMIRQPDFVTADYALDVIARTKKKKPHKLLDEVQFKTECEGKCVQMMHIGPYDDEPASFLRMEDFCVESGLRRLSKTHREIYISDFRKTAPERLKTVLRFRVDL